VGETIDVISYAHIYKEVNMDVDDYSKNALSVAKKYWEILEEEVGILKPTPRVISIGQTIFQRSLKRP
jgi:hypothetical protein